MLSFKKINLILIHPDGRTGGTSLQSLSAIFSTYNSKKNFKKFIKESLRRIFIFLKLVALVFNVQDRSLKKKLSMLEEQQQFLYNNSLSRDVFLKEIK